MTVRVKRVYDGVGSADGHRVLVDRLWPRGLSKQAARVDLWARDLAPSNALRTWFDHDPAKWVEFKSRYTRELSAHRDLTDALLRISRRTTLTLLFAARDEDHSNAVALAGYLKQRLVSRSRSNRKKE